MVDMPLLSNSSSMVNGKSCRYWKFMKASIEKCDVDTSSETAHADMKAWLLKTTRSQTSHQQYSLLTEASEQ